MTDEKLAKLKTLFRNLQIEAKSILFTEEKINEKLLKKLKKSDYDKDTTFVKEGKLFKGNINVNDDEKKSRPIKMTFAEKKDDVDRSTLYSFDGPFQLLHADIGNLEFLGKSATDPKYCLLFVDLFTSKVYVYHMKLRKSILIKMEIFLYRC